MPLGLFGNRFNLKKTFALGAFLQAAGILTPLCTAYFPLLATRIVFAIGTAITVPLATAIAAEWFTSRELPFVTGITMSFVNLGNAFSFIVTVPLAVAFSWNAPLTIYGTFALVCAVAWSVWGKDRPLKPAVEPPIRARVTASNLSTNARSILTQRSSILLAIAAMGVWCLGNAMGAWLPSYYHEVFKMPLEKASSITAIITGAGTVACIIGGILPLRVGRRKPFLIIPGIFMGLFAMGSVLFNNALVIYFCVAGFGFFANFHTPSLFTVPMELPGLSSRNGAIVISLMLVGGNLGNFIGPLLVGYLTDLTGSYLPGFAICAVVSLSLLVVGLLLPETGPAVRKSDFSKSRIQ